MSMKRHHMNRPALARAAWLLLAVPLGAAAQSASSVPNAGSLLQQIPQPAPAVRPNRESGLKLRHLGLAGRCAVRRKCHRPGRGGRSRQPERRTQPARGDAQPGLLAHHSRMGRHQQTVLSESARCCRLGNRAGSFDHLKAAAQLPAGFKPAGAGRQGRSEGVGFNATGVGIMHRVWRGKVRQCHGGLLNVCRSALINGCQLRLVDATGLR